MKCFQTHGKNPQDQGKGPEIRLADTPRSRIRRRPIERLAGMEEAGDESRRGHHPINGTPPEVLDEIAEEPQAHEEQARHEREQVGDGNPGIGRTAADEGRDHGKVAEDSDSERGQGHQAETALELLGTPETVSMGLQLGRQQEPAIGQKEQAAGRCMEPQGGRHGRQMGRQPGDHGHGEKESRDLQVAPESGLEAVANALGAALQGTARRHRQDQG